MAESSRWWIYLQERFPPFKNGLLIAVFAASAVGYTALLLPSSNTSFSLTSSILIAFVVLFLFFFQLRVCDEFKDYADDLRYRPYRAVPRGLVSLQELGVAAIAAAVIQFGFAITLGRSLVFLLLLVWGYMLLMRQEFFVPHWLKVHPVIYMLSHMVIMPLMALFASACYWVPDKITPSLALGGFWAVSFFNGLVIELGRKIRAPQDEEKGVETYTALWGRSAAVLAWLGAMAGMAIATLGAAWPIQELPLVALALLFLLTAAMVVSWRFLSYPVKAWAKGFELLAGVGTLVVYAGLGIVPWVLSVR
ncbi:MULTISPECIES: UbiA family prenyltransferase [unclassified Leptolyngbya]|uniref:UbiA family prenyltransferase n=1 Tax=unclassified Leptolyngbya TaxID=2650499 RepID=UPI001687EC3A|nr:MULTISPECIES: UbiA family prenyltransferase [unclassified Leptolyngbya]MBD1913789.1 UbiA family prenyltransferase [Leptolyngbya sp. FACHB-8]MBD2153605.1 UbiA family prenyltransferase [Leptolyngbya sp. FACHB-16]